MEALSDRVAALEVTQAAVRAVVVGVDRGMPVLRRATEVPLELAGGREGEGSPLYRACQRALGTLGDEVVVSAVEATDVLVRQLHLDVTRERDIDQTLGFQIEPLLPFPIEEAVLDHVVLSRDREGMQLAVLTVPKERLAAHLEQLRAGGVEPERTSCLPAALATLLFRLLPSAEPHGVLHLGDDITTCTIVRQGKVLGCRAVACGVRQLMAAADGDEQLDFQRFDATVGLRLYQRVENLRSEIARSFFALSSPEKGGTSVSQIFLAGMFDSLLNFECFLGQALESPLVRLPEHSPFCSPLGDVTRFAVPLGLALQALPLRTPRIDFRKAEFSYPRPWRRLYRRLGVYFALCLFLAMGILALGSALRGQKRAVLREEYEALSRFAAEVLSDAPPPLSEASLSQVAAGARAIGSRFQALPETYPLLPSVPRVSDVLAWLSTHPNFVTVDPITGESRARVQLENFQYLMVGHPTPKRPKERYRVRVDLEFSAENPTVARELHDALLEPNPFIDPKSEVKWSQNRGLYRTSFFLKDKTHYPAERST